MSVAVNLQAVLMVTSSLYTGPMLSVALPPSDLDPSTSQMRVEVDGVETLIDYDPTMEQP